MDNGKNQGSGEGPASDPFRDGGLGSGAESHGDARASRRDPPTEGGIEGIGTGRGAFGALGASGPFGAAGISLLLNILVERTRAQTWSVERQRAHARALLDLARDHWFTEEETAVLCAFLR